MRRSSLTVASLNTRGVPLVGSRLARRYAVIASSFETGDADVVCLQQVFTFWHLGLLARRMRSFEHVSFRPSVAGPAGGLVTFSRLPVAATAYHGFGVPPPARGVSRLARWRAGLKGVLKTRLARSGLTIVSTHPVANRDGDWSEASRFYPLHVAQLSVLAGAVGDSAWPTVVCGDFNIDHDSSLLAGFLAGTGLADVFEGQCPPTFRAEYLPAGETPRCLDFILASPAVKADATTVLFADQPATHGIPLHVSDHLGLQASLLLMPG